jgi:hypothetical protein
MPSPTGKDRTASVMYMIGYCCARLSRPILIKKMHYLLQFLYVIDDLAEGVDVLIEQIELVPVKTGKVIKR